MLIDVTRFPKAIKSNKANQYLTIIVLSGICYLFSNFMGYRVVAFILLLTVSLIAMIFDIFPVLASALSVHWFGISFSYHHISHFRSGRRGYASFIHVFCHCTYQCGADE